MRWRLWVLQKFLYRFVGICWQPGCKRRPAWYMAQAGAATRTTGLACEDHVTRGCCYPFGSTVCADWDPLPGAKVDGGEADPVRVAAFDEEMAQQMAAYEAAEANQEG